MCNPSILAFSNFPKKTNLTNFHFAGASLIVCFWAEVFHLQEIRWDRPRFLSKSFLGFVAFNIISYSLLIAELVLIWFGQEHLHFYKHIFNGSYAVLMFIGKYYFPSVCTLESGIDVGQRIWMLRSF